MQSKIKSLGLNRKIIAGLSIIVVLTLIAILGPFLSSYSISETDLMHIKSSPSDNHILGTDEVGRDVLARLIYGGRVSLGVGISAMAMQVSIGVLLGSLAGYLGGFVDRLISGIIDTIMCFPFFVAALFAASISGAGTANIVIICGLLMWPSVARVVRGEILSVKERNYIMGARAMGLSKSEILFRYILPNVAHAIVVAATLAIANGILTEASLSFLGLGVNPPTPSWGNMLSAAQNLSALKSRWWLWMPPAMMIGITTFGFHILGEGLRERWSPKDRGGSS
ncbi:MAG: ABC transporter permease [Tissierellia bacterium]|nr:ABC transporter permease [Tissierellia bacterium]